MARKCGVAPTGALARNEIARRESRAQRPGEALVTPLGSSPVYSLPLLLFPSSLSLIAACCMPHGQAHEHVPGWDQGGVLWSLLGGEVSTGGEVEAFGEMPDT